MRIISEKWKEAMINKIINGDIDETIEYNICSVWLIAYLSRDNRPFKVYNLGGGVKRITTKTNVCPCCKKEL
jgi:hypothetical protein